MDEKSIRRKGEPALDEGFKFLPGPFLVETAPQEQREDSSSRSRDEIFSLITMNLNKTRENPPYSPVKRIETDATSICQSVSLLPFSSGDVLAAPKQWKGFSFKRRSPFPSGEEHQRQEPRILLPRPISSACAAVEIPQNGSQSSSSPSPLSTPMPIPLDLSLSRPSVVERDGSEIVEEKANEIIPVDSSVGESLQTYFTEKTEKFQTSLENMTRYLYETKQKLEEVSVKLQILNVESLFLDRPTKDLKKKLDTMISSLDKEE